MSQPAKLKSSAPVMPGPVELAGLGLRQRDQLGHRIDRQHLRHRDADDGVGHPRDRREVLGLVRPVLVHPRMRDERRGRRQQQDVIVLGADEGVDRDDAVAAGPVLDHHRLAPFLGQAVGQQPAADVGAAAGAERQDELDVARRPSLRLAGDGAASRAAQAKNARQSTRERTWRSPRRMEILRHLRFAAENRDVACGRSGIAAQIAMLSHERRCAGPALTLARPPRRMPPSNAEQWGVKWKRTQSDASSPAMTPTARPWS